MIGNRGTKAAEQGNMLGPDLIGNLYATGEGVMKDVAQAVKWHNMVRQTRQHGPTGGPRLPYPAGDGAPKIEYGIKRMKLAAAQGHQGSIDNLEK